MNLLALDIGNTNITAGIFKGNVLKAVHGIVSDKTTAETDYKFLIEEITAGENIDACVISSVVNELTPVITNICANICRKTPLVIDAGLILPIKIKTDSPDEVGADRIVNASQASVEYPLPAAVVDFGTATTIDIVSEKKEFLGGIIIAGMKMQAKALAEKTSKLPEIDLKKSDTLIGKNTVDAMTSGIIRGSAAAIEGLISQIELELGKKLNLIATGGYCKTASKYMTRRFDVIDRNLTIKGLKTLYEMNL